jgi:hypothetical protein
MKFAITASGDEDSQGQGRESTQSFRESSNISCELTPGLTNSNPPWSTECGLCTSGMERGLAQAGLTTHAVRPHTRPLWDHSWCISAEFVVALKTPKLQC